MPFWDLFVVGEFLLELEDLLAEQSDGAAAAVLVEDDAVLDVARPVGVLERVQRLHEVAVGRRAARDHQRPTARRKKKTNEKTNKQMNSSVKAVRENAALPRFFLPLFDPYFVMTLRVLSIDTFQFRSNRPNA